MFAVLKTGGKQYRVKAGDVLRVEKLVANAGDKVQFNDILMVGGTVGAPMVDGACVQAEVIDQIKAEKVITYVKRRRKHSSQRTRGHRQQLTLLRVTDVLEAGADKTGVTSAIGARTDGANEEATEKPARSGAAAVGTKPANLMAQARDGKADDLKKISGVGPKLEALLQENGVFHFDQIAEWTKAEIEYMDDLLSFKGRIERDDWTKQATELAKAKKD